MIMRKEKAYFNWSSGKDSALSLYKVLQDEKLDVSLLLTSVNAFHDRVSMHGVRRELLEEQTKAIGIPLQTIDLPKEPSMKEYTSKMEEVVSSLKNKGYKKSIFGDIFLEDLKRYREKQLQKLEIECVFPIWKQDTRKLVQEFIDLGFKSIVVATKSEKLDASFVGRIIDEDFLNDLPNDVDPCGENGEFHTFCFDGPIFKQPVRFQIGEKIYREYQRPKNTKKEDEVCTTSSHMGFWFQELLPNY